MLAKHAADKATIPLVKSTAHYAQFIRKVLIGQSYNAIGQISGSLCAIYVQGFDWPKVVTIAELDCRSARVCQVCQKGVIWGRIYQAKYGMTRAAMYQSRQPFSRRHLGTDLIEW